MVLGGNMYGSKGGHKDTASGKMPDNGLSEKERDNNTPESLGMGSRGPNQMPMGVAKGKVSTDRGSFNMR